VTPPLVLRGARAIGKHLGIRAKAVEHLDRAGHLPTFRKPGESVMLATVLGLNDWRQLALVELPAGGAND
jgi:hypothetical protein